MMRLVIENARIKLNEALRDEYLERSSRYLLYLVENFNQTCKDTIRLLPETKIDLIKNGDLRIDVKHSKSLISDLLNFQIALTVSIDELKYWNISDGYMYLGDTQKSNIDNFWFLMNLEIPYEILIVAQIDERENQRDERNQKHMQDIKQGKSLEKFSQERRKNYLDM
jgi:hypothetical protein